MLRAELAGLKVGALRKRARAESSSIQKSARPTTSTTFVAASAVPSFERDDTPFRGSAIKADALGWIFFRPL